MFDFLPSKYIIENPNDCSSDIQLSSSSLSDKIIDNIELFRNGVSSLTKSKNTPDNYKFYKPLGGANIKDIYSFLLSVVKKRKSNK